MLTKLHLVNYKSYKNTEIETKPITIFCGGNSSGKTSIIKSILLMKQSFEASGNNCLLISGPRVRVPGGAPEKPHSSVEKRAVWLLFLCQMASLTTF